MSAQNTPHIVTTLVSFDGESNVLETWIVLREMGGSSGLDLLNKTKAAMPGKVFSFSTGVPGLGAGSVVHYRDSSGEFVEASIPCAYKSRPDQP